MNGSVWETIAPLARYAPTPHNTQPFRIRPLGPEAAELIVLSERMLPVEDTGNLYVMASFGIFAETIERAARHFGIRVRVTALPSVRPTDLGPGSGAVVIGRADVLGRCAAEEQARTLVARRTSRLPYDGREVSRQAVAEFTAIAADQGHRFECHDDPVLVREVLSRNIMALLENNLKKHELSELRRWVRVGETPECGDGLWSGPMNQPRWEMRLALAAPRLFLLPLLGPLARAKYLRTQAGTRQIAILRGPFQTWPDLVRAGRALMQVWLSMTAHGVYMLPFGSMITNASCNSWLRERFGAPDIWFILRFGYSATPPKAPRLPSVLLLSAG